MLDVSRRRFGELVNDALDTVPAELLRLLDNVVALAQRLTRAPPDDQC